MYDCILAHIQWIYAPVYIWTAEQGASVFHSFICSVFLCFFPLETSMEVDCKAHTTESGTWLTSQWLQKHVTTAASPSLQPIAQEGDVELNLCYSDELTIEQFNAPVIKTLWTQQHFSALPHRFVGIGGFHLESWGSLLFLTLFSLTQIRSATPLQIHFPNFSCLRRAPSAQGW